MSISNPQNCNYVYIHTSQIILWLIPNPLYYAFLDYFFWENYAYFQRSFSSLAFMSISIWLSPNYLFFDNYGHFHMPFYTDPLKCFDFVPNLEPVKLDHIHQGLDPKDHHEHFRVPWFPPIKTSDSEDPTKYSRDSFFVSRDSFYPRKP